MLRRKHSLFSVVPRNTLRFYKLCEPICQTPSKTRLSLDANFDGLHGAESNVCNYFGRCRTSKVYQSFVLGCILCSNLVRIELLEELVKSKLAGTLSTVTKQGRHPPPEEPSRSLLLEQNSKTRRDILVLCGVDLKFGIEIKIVATGQNQKSILKEHVFCILLELGV